MVDVAGAAQLRRLLDAITSLGSELSLPVVLRNITEVATDLVDARYGAVGVLDRTHTRLAELITVGSDEAGIAAIGGLPEGLGILGGLVLDGPLRLPDLARHPDSRGFPPHHPDLASFLGVPIWVRDTVFGNLYLAQKAGGGAFSDVDEELAVGLAAAAGVAVENARLHEQVQDVAVLEDRERIARDLHDTVVQRLFATGLSLQGVQRRLAAHPDLAARIQQSVDDLGVTVRQVRSAIFQLQPVTSSSGSVRRAILAVATEQAPTLGFEPVVRFDGPVDTAVDGELADSLLNTVREALSNVARHARAGHVDVEVTVAGGELLLRLADDGVGIAPRAAVAAPGQGLANMRERAERLGGTFRTDPAPDGGTVVTWRVPLG
jgi:signal transduction histidine kinase